MGAAFFLFGRAYAAARRRIGGTAAIAA